MIVEFLELIFSRHGTCKLLCDTSLALARSSPTRRYTGIIPARTTRNPEFLFVPAGRIRATLSALFARLPRAFNTFVQTHPSFDMFYDSKSTLLRLYYHVA